MEQYTDKPGRLAVTYPIIDGSAAYMFSGTYAGPLRRRICKRHRMKRGDTNIPRINIRRQQHLPYMEDTWKFKENKTIKKIKSKTQIYRKRNPKFPITMWDWWITTDLWESPSWPRNIGVVLVMTLQRSKFLINSIRLKLWDNSLR